MQKLAVFESMFNLAKLNVKHVDYDMKKWEKPCLEQVSM